MTHLVKVLNWLIFSPSIVLDTIQLVQDLADHCCHSPALLEDFQLSQGYAHFSKI
jgi:hypothetical protein